MASNREYSTTDAAHGLKGFSSNSGALGDPDALWSHQPVQEGPKAGFHDPIAAEPARKQLEPSGSPDMASDDSVSTSLSGGTL